ncbi:MAG TPA: LytTR family DNA-binding domain-containing protein [Puia sp.]|nr:LytTR family DNA-binding domain-containing protein [Puia sp.]
MLLKAIIVDDEPVARKVLREYIEDIDYLELVGMAEHPLKADALMAEKRVDLLFLDINMPKLNGIDFLRASGGLSARPLVIITTAYAEYALDGFDLDVVDYLVKPISFERFLKACQKARSRQGERLPAGVPEEARPADHFFVKCGDSLEKIVYGELLYIEAMMNYVVLHTTNRKLIVYLTLKSILAQLPPHHFVQVHKSFVVNGEFVSSIRGNMLQLGTASVPVSQHYYEEAMRGILRDRVVKRNGI